MIDSLWVDAWHLLGGAVCSNENIVYDAKGYGEIYSYHFSDTCHITLDINSTSSQMNDRESPISSHSQGEFSIFDSV
jgi:hypothetical protein